MKIIFHKTFLKQYTKLDTWLANKSEDAIKKFQHNPYDPSLHNHLLHGDMSGLRAFSVTGDIRIIFEVQGNYALVIFLEIGGHNKVY